VNDLAVQVRGLVKRFGSVVAVAGIDFEVARGACLGLLGPNGAGKTTTVEILEGLQRPTSGEVRVLGLSWERDAEALRARIGIGLQETLLYDRLTVEETVKLFRSFFRRGADVEAVITQVNLGEKRRTQVGKLSGGQRQRLALATALVGEPEVLFLDEPTTGLDPQSRRALWDVITGFKAKGCTVLLTTHYMEEAERLCDRVTIVDRGCVVADGSPGVLIASVGAAQLIEVKTVPALMGALWGRLPGVRAVQDGPTGTQLSVSELHVTLPAVLETVRAQGASVVHLNTRAGTLDDVFLAYTGRHLREDGGNGA
jgi:ABC-2 type transport system ATP-binding protein